MKKTYFAPATEVVEAEITSEILVESTITINDDLATSIDGSTNGDGLARESSDEDFEW